MKNFIRKVLPILAVVIAVVTLTQFAVAWVQANTGVAIDSGEIYSAQSGAAGSFESNMNKDSYSIASANDTVRFLPGDRLYYTFVCDVAVTALHDDNDLNLGVKLTLRASPTDDAPQGAGDWQAFLNDLQIEANTVEVAVLHREDGSVCDYTIQSVNGNLHVTNATSPVSVSNTAQVGFLSSGNVPAAETVITVTGMDWTDDVITDNLWTDGSGNQKLSLMLYIPIWYRDTGAAQDAGKDCLLCVSGCEVTVHSSN